MRIHYIVSWFPSNLFITAPFATRYLTLASERCHMHMLSYTHAVIHTLLSGIVKESQIFLSYSLSQQMIPRPTADCKQSSRD